MLERGVSTKSKGAQIKPKTRNKSREREREDKPKLATKKPFTKYIGWLKWQFRLSGNITNNYRESIKYDQSIHFTGDHTLNLHQ